MSEQTLEELRQNMARQQERGEYGYWSAESEAAHKANAPERPKPPAITEARRVSVSANQYHPARPDPDKYGTWDSAMQIGRSYLVGDQVPMEKFIADHRSPLTEWQKLCYEWAKANPFYVINLRIGHCDWRVSARGEYVNFSLPYHDAGGEKDYVSNNGKSKILVNVD